MPCARWVADSRSAFIARFEQCHAILRQKCMIAAPERLLDAMRQVGQTGLTGFEVVRLLMKRGSAVPSEAAGCHAPS